MSDLGMQHYKGGFTFCHKNPHYIYIYIYKRDLLFLQGFLWGDANRKIIQETVVDYHLSVNSQCIYIHKCVCVYIVYFYVYVYVCVCVYLFYGRVYVCVCEELISWAVAV